MSFPLRVRSRRPGWAARAAFWAALVGLLAMHGVAGHAATHQPASEPVGVPLAAHGSVTHGQPSADAERPGDPGDAGGSTSELLGLCLAVLGVAIAGLLTLRARSLPLLRRDRAVPTPVLAPPRGRDRDPPCLVTLSIQRC